MIVKGNLKGHISWNGWNYAYREMKSGNKYYKSKNVRFDDTCGGTEECSSEEYFEAAEKYAKIIR
jgi:hypothetical protein